MKRAFLIVVMCTLMLTLFVVPAMGQDAANTLRIALQQEPDTLNRYYSQMWFATTVIDLLMAPTWWINDETEAVPAIAAEIPSLDNGGISADGTAITFKIRDDAVWSDGTPITADDFVFTYQMLIAPSNTMGTRYPWDEKVKSVEASDSKTVVITTNEPFAPWLAQFNLRPYPKHILEPVFQADGTLDTADWNRAPSVVSGPYKFVEWQAGSHMSLTRNENYFLGQAKIENVFISFVPDDATVVASLISGDSDLGTFIAAGDTPALKETGKINIVLAPSGYNEGLFFNVSPELGHPALQDVNVRKALVMLVDRDTINKDLNLGLVYTGSSYWENTPYVRPNAAPIPYDPEAAKKMLDEAGWVDSNGDGTRDKDGVEMVLRYITNQRQLRKDVQAIVQQAYADAGIKVELQNYASDVFFAPYSEGGPMSTGQYDLGEYSSNPFFPDPDVQRFLCSQVPSDEFPDGNNDNHYCNPELDKLFAEQAKTVDPEKRIEIFQKIDQMLFDDVVWTNMWYDPDLFAINSRISNALISGADPFWNAVDWEISS